MPNRIELAGLQIDAALHSLLTQEIAPGTGVDPESFLARRSRYLGGVGS